jgi:hypothetical protein
MPLGRSPLDAIAPSRLAGRERELGQLQESWKRAEAGQGGLVLIRGEAGAGKTRLEGHAPYLYSQSVAGKAMGKPLFHIGQGHLLLEGRRHRAPLGGGPARIAINRLTNNRKKPHRSQQGGACRDLMHF